MAGGDELLTLAGSNSTLTMAADDELQMTADINEQA
jgi:hypothetical protein